MLKLTPTCVLGASVLALFPHYRSGSRPVIAIRELTAAVRRKTQVLAQLESLLRGTGPPSTYDKGSTCRHTQLASTGLDP